MIDGTGSPGRAADICIKDGDIVAVEPGCKYNARAVIDATGMIVTPGLIDCHSHTDATIRLNPGAESTVYQGVTTEIVGNCGNTIAPITEATLRNNPGTGFGDKPPEITTFAGMLVDIERMGTSINLAWLAGHNTIRAAAGVTGETATDDELSAMEAHLAEALEAGAIGFSTGLEFEPGRLCKTDELAYLLRTVKQYDGIYASHIRNRDARVLEAVDEFIDLMRGSGVRGQLSHMNMRYNTGAPERAFDTIIEKMYAARSDGYELLADMTPLQYGIGSGTGILPAWFTGMSNTDQLAVLADPARREGLRSDTDRYWRFMYNGEWDRVLVQSAAAAPEINGMAFNDIAALWGKPPWDCYCEILIKSLEQSGGIGGIVLIAKLFTEAHLRETIAHPLYCLAADGYSTLDHGPLAQKTAFPLHYMGMAHFLAHHVKIGTLTLETAVHKMTGMPASHFRLGKRGLLKAGYRADVAVIDYDNLQTPSAFGDPARYTEGVSHVFVGGVPVVSNGKHTDARPGINITFPPS